MRKALIGILMILLLTAMSLGETTAEFNMPGEEVLKLGLDKFVEIYLEKTGDNSEAGQDEAYYYYYKCKRLSNDAEAKKLPPALRKQVNSTRDAISDWENSFISLEGVASGGGSLYTHWQNREVAPREDFVGEIMALLKKGSKANLSARKETEKIFARIKSWVGKKEKPDEETRQNMSYLENSEELYFQYYKDLKKATNQLSGVLKSLPDDVVLKVARYIERNLNL